MTRAGGSRLITDGMGALLVCVTTYFTFGAALAWFFAFLWAANKAVEHHRDAERWKNNHAAAVRWGEENAKGEIIVKGVEVPGDDRVERVSGKLKAHVASLQKMNTDLQDEIRKRDKIIAEMRESQKPKREMAKTNG